MTTFQKDKYFSGIDFPELEQPIPVITAPIENDLEGIDWTTLLGDIGQMISAVGTGESEITPHPLDLKNAPIWKALKSLKDAPSKKTLANFLDIARQDVNNRFRSECIRVFHQVEKLKKFMEDNKIG